MLIEKMDGEKKVCGALPHLVHLECDDHFVDYPDPLMQSSPVCAPLREHKGAVRDGPASGRTVTVLADLPPGSMLDEKALAQALGVSTRTVRRMVDKCQLPGGVLLGARKVWFSGKVLAFLSERADRETVEARKRAARLGNVF